MRISKQSRINLMSKYYRELDYIEHKCARQERLKILPMIETPNTNDIIQRLNHAVALINNEDTKSVFNHVDTLYYIDKLIFTYKSLHTYEYKDNISGQIVDVILFEDSDLYAVICELKWLDNFQNFNQIWVSKSIEKNFVSLVTQYFKKFKCPIHAFQFKEELLTPPVLCKINITCIWSEDIVAAKNLAASLDRTFVFINMMPFQDVVLCMPHMETFRVCKSQLHHSDEDQYIISTIQPTTLKNKKPLKKSPNPFYDYMFYDGVWQKPVNDTYWIQNNVIKAQATRDDIIRCVASSRKAYKDWSSQSTQFRIQALSTLASAIKDNRLSEIVIKWIKFPYWYKCMQFYFQSKVTRIRKPKGIITLMEKDETVLFRKLIQSLIIGNTVIIICTAKTPNLVQYCDIFLKTEIPPGVINLLSCEDVKLLSDGYMASNLSDVHCQFTVSKQIITNF
ncbi:hypothetical protein P5V15_003540 [Pogonomyrmex californicus]